MVKTKWFADHVFGRGCSSDADDIPSYADGTTQTQQGQRIISLPSLLNTWGHLGIVQKITYCS